METSDIQALGLRDRQKSKRRTLILDCAKALFEEQGYDATTMAKIAESAEVSTPTVFNYFGSKDHLIVEMVFTGHKLGRTAIANWQPKPDLTFGQLLSEMMCLYTDLTIAICGRRVWRYAEATNIRRPTSDVVDMYSKIETTHVAEICAILTSKGPRQIASNREQCALIARVVYNHWNALFLNYIRDESMKLGTFKRLIRSDMQQLAELFCKSGDKP